MSDNEQVPPVCGAGGVYGSKEAMRDLFTAGFLAGYQWARNNKPETVSADKIMKAARAEFDSLKKENTP